MLRCLYDMKVIIFQPPPPSLWGRTHPFYYHRRDSRVTAQMALVSAGAPEGTTFNQSIAV